MSWLIDASTLIDLSMGEVAAQSTLEKLEPEGVFSSVLCLYEAWRSLTQRAPQRAGAAVLLLLESIEWVPLSLEAATRAARLNEQLLALGTPAPTIDLLIAATALERGAGVVTEDADFDLIPGLVVRGTRD